MVDLRKRDHATDVGTAVIGGVKHAIGGGGWAYTSRNKGVCGVRLSGRESYFSNRQIRVTCRRCVRILHAH